MPSARSTNNSFLDALALSLATAVVLTERLVVPTLVFSLKLLEDLLSQKSKPQETPMPDLEVKQQDYIYVEAPAEEASSPKVLDPESLQ